MRQEYQLIFISGEVRGGSENATFLVTATIVVILALALYR